MMTISTSNEFFDFSDNYLFILKEGIIQKTNKTFRDSLGYEEEQLIGKHIQEIILPKDLLFFTPAFEANEKVVAQLLTEKRKAKRVEWEFKERDGLTLVKGVDVTEVLKHKERFEQYSVLLRGVNESLERSSHRLFLLQSTLTNTIPYAKDAITNVLKITIQTFRFNTAFVTKEKKGALVISDIVGEKEELKGTIIQNPNALSQKVFNFGMELVHSLEDHDFIEDEDVLLGGKNYLGFPINFNGDLLGTVEMVFNNDTSNISFDNNDIQFLKLITEVVGRIMELQRINGELEDKTDRLEVKNNELDEFAHIVSHDLKAPLRAIKNLISFIGDEDGNVLTQESKDDFGLIQNRADRMGALIEGVLEYSRVGRVETPTTTFSLNDIVLEVTEQLRPMNTKVQFEITPNFPIMVNKELFMFQIVSNLISNAIKYNDKDQPIIKIDFKDVHNKVTLIVEDNGPGIEDEFKERVFGVFETLQGRDEVESTGIGLTIVKKMSLFMGGDAWIEDSDMGGAKFIVEFLKKM